MTRRLERLQNFILVGYVDDHIKEPFSNCGQAFGGLLLHQGNIFQISPHRCRYLLSALGDAVLLNRFSDPQKADKVKLGPLDDYTLEQSSSRGVDGIALGSKIKFHQ